MSGPGAPELEYRGTRGRIVAVVAASWHAQVMDGLIAGAMRVLEAADARAVLLRVPGTFELPLAVKEASLREVGAALGLSGDGHTAVGVVALGVVIRGGTPHFEYVCQAATWGLTKVALETRKPIGFGVLTCDNVAQALDRAGLPGSTEDKGGEAAAAVLATLDGLDRFGKRVP
jgi:6,7-dimethyl-8-ribityllumazine synthase